MTIYQLFVETDLIQASYLFAKQPTKADIQNLMITIWRKLKEDTQDQMWDLLLLIESSPDILWLGEHSNLFGMLAIKPVGVIENRDSISCN